MWFDKNELRLYLNIAKKFRLGGGRGPPLNTPMTVDQISVSVEFSAIRNFFLNRLFVSWDFAFAWDTFAFFSRGKCTKR